MHDDNRASSVRAPSPEPGPPDQADRRGSHATTYGQGFSWVMIWTILGALIPGAGLVAAGWRRLGALLLFLVGLGLAGLAAFALTGDVLKKIIKLVTDTQNLLYVAAGAAALGIIWGVIILFTHSQLRRYANLNGGQRAFSGLVVVALLVAVAVPAYKVGSTAILTRSVITSIAPGDDDGTTVDPSNGTKADPWAGVDRMNVLLIGSDAGRGRTGTRPDTMIVASIDVKSGNTVLISLPRNLERAPFAPGTGGAQAWPYGFFCPADQCLLNAVWKWGEDNAARYYPNSKNPGLRATEDAIEGVTGLKINTWASLNLKGFQEFVDALGGVRMNVKERLPIAGNSEGGCGLGGYIQKGKQKLDGFHALWYARSRCSTNDFDRIRRQRCVIGAVVQQADPATMVQQFSKIASAAKNNILTGISPSKFDAWVELALRVKSATVTSLPFDDTVVKDRTNPDYEQIHSLVKKALKESVAPVKATPAKATPTTPASAGPTSGSTSKPKSTKAPVTETPGTAQNIKDVC